MPVMVLALVLIALLLFAGIGYLAVLRFRRVRLKADVLKVFSFEVEGERDGAPQ